MALLRVSALAMLLLAAGSSVSGRLGVEGEAVAPAPGPALRAALAERSAGDAAGAAEAFGALARSTPEIADHASELRIDALLAAGNAELALGEAQSFRTGFADSWLLALVLEHEGMAQAALGNEAAARAGFAAAREHLRARDVAGQARLLAETASSHERSGEAAAAAELWREIWTRYATSAEAPRAEEALEHLAAQDPALEFRTAGAWRERCERLSAALRNEEALRSCDAALAAAPGERSLLRARADLLFRMRRYGDAVAAFSALGDDPDAVFWRARSLARAGRTDDALASFARIAKGPNAELAARARFLAGTLLEDTDRAAAEASYRLVAARAPLAEQRAAADWRLAWLAWRRGDFAVAARLLEGFASNSSDPSERTRGDYWRGRAEERLGRAEGRERLARLAQAEPLSYYGWRAASRLGDAAVGAAEVAATPVAPPAGAEPVLDSRTLRRIQILLEGGLDERAGIEIEELRARDADPGAQLVYAQLLLEAGRFDRAQRLVLDQDTSALVQRPAPGAEARWWLAWPTAYARSVDAAARRHGVDSALVYAIMREESGYQPDAVSVVGARGLTQIMPDTGRRLASDLGAAAFDPAELFVPERNLELGAFYLSRLLDRFDGRMSAAIASYNAGPEAVSRWLAADASAEDDEWVESIPYDQTRGYVRRVLRSMHVYRALYGS